MTATVALVRATDYRQSRTAVEKALELLGVGDSFFTGKRVALKVNMMKGAPPERALCTHPEFVRAVAGVVREAGGVPFVCDSSGILGFTGEAFEAAGYTKMCAEENLELIDLDSEKPLWQPIRQGKRLDGIWMGKAAVEADLLVSLPKLKTHTIAGLTWQDGLVLAKGIPEGDGAGWLYLERRHHAYYDFLLGAPEFLGRLEGALESTANCQVTYLNPDFKLYRLAPAADYR